MLRSSHCYAALRNPQPVRPDTLVKAARLLDQAGHQGIPTSAETDWRKIGISENGSGTPAEIGKKITEPFFMTNPVGKGTGPCMSISHDLFRSQGGWIELETELGLGMTFTILLPGDGIRTVEVAE